MQKSFLSFLQNIKTDILAKWMLAGLFLLGYLARVYFLGAYGNGITLMSDDAGYVNSAKTLIETGVLTYRLPSPTAFIMPAYPLFLSFFILPFGMEDGLLIARLIQILVNLAGIYMVYLIARRFIKNRFFALLPVALLMFYPPSILTPGLLLTETWYTTLMLLCLYLSLRFLDKPGMKLAVLLGIFYSLAVYFRPIIVLFPVIVCVLLLFLKRGISFVEKFRLGLVWALVMVVFLAPWWVRNYRTFNTFIPLTAASGNPLLYGTYINFEGIDHGYRSDWPKGNNEFEGNKLQLEMAMERIRSGFKENFPGYVRWYTIGKLKYMWKYPFDWFTVKEFSYHFVVRYHYLILFTGFLGILIYLFKKPADYHVLLIFIAYSTLIYMVYVTSARYCYPQIYLTAIFSGFFAERAVKFISAFNRTFPRSA